MDVLGHEDEPPEREVVLQACPLDRLREPRAGPLGREEAVTMLARERQLVGVSRLIEVPGAWGPMEVGHPQHPRSPGPNGPTAAWGARVLVREGPVAAGTGRESGLRAVMPGSGGEDR